MMGLSHCFWQVGWQVTFSYLHHRKKNFKLVRNGSGLYSVMLYLSGEASNFKKNWRGPETVREIWRALHRSVMWP